ncbi:MAG: hypothetical protein GF405_09855 [Candidatus Eisenbacteria bacterium]|nr:hypothetical protein [Candidatus Eisenbacteria bacterium]
MTRWPRPAALLLGILLPAIPVLSSADAPDPADLAALRLIEPALEATGSSDAVWPGWDISDVPLALLSPGRACILVHHPRPPVGFRRLSHSDDLDLTIYRGEPDSISIPTAELGRTTAAVVERRELEAAGPAVVFERAFLVHETELCSRALEPVDLTIAYPVTAKNLVLSDIECEILVAAGEAMETGAAPAVVESMARDFVCVRSFRRIQMGNRFAEYERRLELRYGLPRYVAGRMLERTSEQRTSAVFEEAVARSRDKAGRGLGDRPWCTDPGADLTWYRELRFGPCGASVCRLLDATVPGWKERVRDDCVDPYSVLEERFRLEAPRPAHVTPRYGYETRLAERAAFAEEALTPGERRFNELTRGDSLRFCVNTHLLANVSVSYERNTMTEVDGHRQIHERILRLEFSGTTRLELVGRPCAVIVENGAFDVRQVILPAPERFTLKVGGREVALEHGIHEIDEPHRVEARGFLLEAERTVVFVSDERITFVIHR